MLRDMGETEDKFRKGKRDAGAVIEETERGKVRQSQTEPERKVNIKGGDRRNKGEVGGWCM